MTTISASQLASQMLAAALPVLEKGADNVESFAELEFTKLAQTMVSLGEQLAAGEITQVQASLLLDMQKHAARTVLLTIEGLGILAVEQAINAALAVVKTAVNAALGFAII
jgi:hypothetical protein